jgi:general secretion pathway protein H
LKKLQNKKGFTLLEVLMVLFLITLIIGLSAAVFSNALPSQKLEASAREIMATFRHARSSAISEGKWQTVIINMEARNFGIEGGRTRNIPDSVSLKIVDNINGEITEGAYRFVFSPVGVAEGGTVVLSTGKRVVSVDIDPVLGAVRSKVQ